MSVRIERMESTGELSVMKQQYIERATAPLDGMWLCGFVPMANHFGFHEGDELVGYCCVNDDGYLLQYYMKPSHPAQSSQVFEAIVSAPDSPAGQIKGAFVSTAEPCFLSLCLDHFSKFTVNALMYQFDRESHRDSEPISLTPVHAAQLPEAVEFAVDSIGAPAGWLSGYYDNLIKRGELYGSWNGDELVATGECRRKDEYQTEFADVGMIVAKSQRGKGLGTQILKQLVAINRDNGLQSICSTETSNIAAQTAITRAGFHAGNRILQFHSTDEPS